MFRHSIDSSVATSVHSGTPSPTPNPMLSPRTSAELLDPPDGSDCSSPVDERDGEMDGAPTTNVREYASVYTPPSLALAVTTALLSPSCTTSQLPAGLIVCSISSYTAHRNALHAQPLKLASEAADCDGQSVSWAQ